MSSRNDLDVITSQFDTLSKDMPHISTSSMTPKYTTVKNVQDIKVLSIMSYSTELSHLALTGTAADLKKANGSTSFIIPVNPGTIPTPPARIATRASAAALADDPTATAETTDPFQAQEAIIIFQKHQRQFNRYRNAGTALKNYIINSVDDKYIKTLKHKITRYAKVSLLKLLTHIWTTYRAVTIVDLKVNEAQMKI